MVRSGFAYGYGYYGYAVTGGICVNLRDLWVAALCDERGTSNEQRATRNEKRETSNEHPLRRWFQLSSV